jgi:hypothetical protein
MLDNRILSDDTLRQYTSSPDLADQAHALLRQQQETWETLRSGYETLTSVQTKSFSFEGFELKVQFNPGRLTSSSAKVDEKSIRERKCFLCIPHLPPEQRGLAYGEEYVLLCNPFPIFPEHFTIPLVRHEPQRIDTTFDTLLLLAKALHSRYTAFYNGPRCGASAPDHLHFQAGTRGFMPLDLEYESIGESHGSLIYDSPHVRAYSIDRYLRNILAWESTDRGVLQRVFAGAYDILQRLTGNEEEPLMNVVVTYQAERWRVLLFPRARHRPSLFFAEGEEQILLSPAAVDLGGVCITPREGDFRKITREHLVAIFEEVTLAPALFREVTEGFRDLLRRAHF